MANDRAIPYHFPQHWIAYAQNRILDDLVAAKAAIQALRALPYQRDWLEDLQAIQLKMEVAGTSRIEGAEFTEQELDQALASAIPGADLLTRSQRQARAAVETYRWIAGVPDDRPMTEDLIREVHRRMVTGCDDDHCPPGRLRGQGENVTFGSPRHRGCEGGAECATAFATLVRELNGRFRGHDPLVAAMALHYHFAAMHPFLDGNGRTARAIEALMLQRAGLRDTAFIAMSNYYYEEKPAYLTALADVRRSNHDLTPFLQFALRGVKVQCDRLFAEIAVGVKKALFRNVMLDLFQHLRTPRKRVLAVRQMEILNVMLNRRGPLKEARLLSRLESALYSKLKNPLQAFVRDVDALIHLGALRWHSAETLELNLDWPAQITVTDFMARIKSFPKAKSHRFLRLP